MKFHLYPDEIDVILVLAQDELVNTKIGDVTYFGG